MIPERDLFRVSCKCAIFTPDLRKVLLADYGSAGYGLPGGHINLGETPDQAMRRELFEELGLEDVLLHHADFLLHPNGKIVLGFVSQIEESTDFKVQLDEIQGVVWVGITSIQNGEVEVPSYKDFILNAALNAVV